MIKYRNKLEIEIKEIKEIIMKNLYFLKWIVCIVYILFILNGEI